MGLRNAFEELATTSDASFLRRLLRGISRVSYDATNQLRAVVTGSSVSISSGTVTTVTTGNISIGDAGKPITSLLYNRTQTASGNKRNIIRG